MKVAVVTGASRGLGAEIARALGAAGWAVAVNYAHDQTNAEKTAAAITAAGGKAAAMEGKLVVPVNGHAGSAPDGAVTVGFRSEDIRVRADEATEAVVHHVENHGVEQIVTLRVGGHLVKATVPAVLPVAVDGKVRFGVDPARVHCFDAKSGVNLGAG